MSDYKEFSEENPHFPWWASTAAMVRWQNLIKPMLGHENSPDLPELNQYKHHLVFVYGSLKRNKYAHGKLKGCPLLFSGLTKHPSFLLWQTKGAHGFPVMLIKGKDEDGAKAIQGEVYIVSTPTMKTLDAFEHNGELYRRIKLRIMSTGENAGKEVSAWTYVGIKGVWEREVEEGKLRICPAFKMKKEPKLSYYTFIQ